MRPRSHVPAGQALVLDALGNHIEKVLDKFYDFGVRTGWKETDDSPLAEERSRMAKQYGPGRITPTRAVRHWDGSSAGHAAASCLLFTAVAGQHLEGIRLMLRAREVIFAPAPPARSVLEIAGHVFWLLDPNVASVRLRAARSWTAQLSDATRKKTAGLAVNHPDAPKFGASVRQLRRETIPQLFYPSEVDHTKDGKVVLCNQAHPGFEETLTFISRASGVPWNTSGMYAYLSNASHPTLHVITDSLEIVDGDIRGFALEDVSLPYRITRMAIMCFVRCWQVTAAYHGLDQREPGDLGEEIDTLPEP